jgi:hypothetical protein
MPGQRHASCSCGRLSLVAEGDPIRVSVCHCLACQKRTGSAFGLQARFDRQQVTISGDSTEYVRTGDSGGRAHFHFCASCGATVFYRLEGQPDIVAVPVGAFADPQFPPPIRSVYEDRRHAWVGLPQDMQHES